MVGKLVFAGPSLQRADKVADSETMFLPPAVQGSFIIAVERYKPTAILLIDGGFEGVAAVRHKEILWAISQGVAVLGAASMGALRAAELSPWVQGVGLIYRWYRRFSLTPDDAVAVQHGPAELDFAAVTDAMVDLRLTFKAAARQNIISAELKNDLVASAQHLHFRDRKLAHVVAEVMKHEDAKRLTKLLQQCYKFQKRKDALAALALLHDGSYRPPPPLQHLPLTRVFAEEYQVAVRKAKQPHPFG